MYADKIIVLDDGHAVGIGQQDSGLGAENAEGYRTDLRVARDHRRSTSADEHHVGVGSADGRDRQGGVVRREDPCL